jgi:tyrosinase
LHKAAKQTTIGTADDAGKKLCVSRINRAPISGSFIISAYATQKGQQYFPGYQSVLNRWSVTGYTNCMNHLEVKAFFDPDLPELSDFKDTDVDYRIIIHGCEHSSHGLKSLVGNKLYHLEVR